MPTFVTYIHERFRDMVSDQINDFRQQVFSGDGVQCAITGLDLIPSITHIDHADPQTFDAIAFDYVKAFIGKLNLKWQRFGSKAIPFGLERWTIRKMMDLQSAPYDEFDFKWSDYHQKHAHLRPVFKTANLHLPKSEWRWMRLCQNVIITDTSWEADAIFGATGQPTAAFLKAKKHASDMPDHLTIAMANKAETRRAAEYFVREGKQVSTVRPPSRYRTWGAFVDDSAAQVVWAYIVQNERHAGPTSDMDLQLMETIESVTA